MKNLYEQYLSIPKFTRFSRAINIYTKGWYVQTGLAICPPHPHRHYTMGEFMIAFEEKEDLREYLTNKPWV